MSEAIVVAIITGGLSLLGVIITVVLTTRKSNADLFAKLDKQSELSDAKLDKEIAVVKTEIVALSAEVRKHNGHSERITTLEEKAKAADRRLTELEHTKRAG